MNLLVVEMRRALHRRVVRVLIVLALIGCATVGVIAFTTSVGKSIAELQVDGNTHPAVMRDWWVAGSGDGVLAIASFMLVLGGLFGGASVAGAEWRAGTVTTLLTWEPRRVRVHLSRTAACAILAFLMMAKNFPAARVGLKVVFSLYGILALYHMALLWHYFAMPL